METIKNGFQSNGSSNSRSGERNCKVCGLTFPDIYSYTDHLESKEHIKSIMKKKYGVKYLEAKAQLNECATKDSKYNEKTKNAPINRNENRNDSKSDKYLDSQAILSNTTEGKECNIDSEISDDDAEVYTCEQCKKICTGIVNYKLHLAGRKHLKTVKRNKMIKEMKKEQTIVKNSDDEDNLLGFTNAEEYASKEYLCKLCNKTCTGPQSYKQHNQSEGHKRKLEAQKAMKDISDQQLQNEEDASEDDQKVPIAKCESCSKCFSGPIPYKQHLESTAHFKQIRHQKQMAKLKDAAVGLEDKKYFCNDCNKHFSGPLPYQEHIGSPAHDKKREKNDLMKMLLGKYKEMTIIQEPKIDSEDSDNDQIISCKMCHISFSGPKSAQDHFQCQRHKKVAKEKKRLQRLKMKANIEVGKKNESTSSDKDYGSDESFDVIG